MALNGNDSSADLSGAGSTGSSIRCRRPRSTRIAIRLAVLAPCIRRMLGELVMDDVLRRHRGRRGTKAVGVDAESVRGARWSLVYWWMAMRPRLSTDELDRPFRTLAVEGLDGAFGPTRRDKQ